MVSENILPYSDLMATAGSPDERDILLETRYQIRRRELSQVRSLPSLEEKIYSAARLLLEKARQVTPGAESSQLTEPTLAAIAYSDWNNPTTKRSCIKNFLAKRYSGEKKATRLKAPSTHFLRRDVGAYSGNLLQAAKIHENFTASDFDFQKSVILPLEIIPQHAYLFGVMWCCGGISNSHGSQTLYLQHNESSVTDGRGPHYPYFDYVRDQMFDMFNLVLDIKPNHRDGGEFVINDETFKSTPREYPRLDIISKAVSSWLIDDIGLFDAKGRSRKLMDSDGEVLTKYDIFPNSYYVKHFIAGIIDAGCTIEPNCSNHHKVYVYPILYTKQKSLLQTIDSMKHHLGYNGNHNHHNSNHNGNVGGNKAGGNNTDKRVYLPCNLLKELYVSGILHNPHHLESIRKNCSDIHSV